MPGIYILGTQLACEDLQKRVLFWLHGPRTVKRRDIFYGVAVRSVFCSGRISCIGAISPNGPFRGRSWRNCFTIKPLLLSNQIESFEILFPILNPAQRMFAENDGTF